MNFKIITLLVIVGVLVAIAEAENPSKLQKTIEIFKYKFRNDKRNFTSKNLKKFKLSCQVLKIEKNSNFLLLIF